MMKLGLYSEESFCCATIRTLRENGLETNTGKNGHYDTINWPN
jgi:hypothetical protein